MQTASQSILGKIGDFEVLRELGRGGMGIVYEARQISLNRKVALKVLSGGLGLTTKAVTRFKREAEAAAKLHHTNIVPIYATGQEDGTHFYAMELIEGPSLEKVIKQMRSGTFPQSAVSSTAAGQTTAVDQTKTTRAGHTNPNASTTHSETSSTLGEGNVYFDAVARMISEVADALEYAHQQGVIHRDIKPSNLLLSPLGRLSVTDFGLARMLEEPGMTLSGEFVGSPLYMSPEQITAGRMRLDHRTDIYSLGATLYQLLTLEPPFPGESRDQIIAQIISKEPKPLRSINRKIPVDLETICLKALEKDPDRRYQTAGQLAEDLRRYVNRFAISARRGNPVQRVVKWAKRHPAIAGMIVALLVLACTTGFMAYQVHLSRLEVLREKQQSALESALLITMNGDLEEAELAIEKAEQLGASVGDIRMLRGQVAAHRGDLATSIRHLEQAVKLLPENVSAWAMLAYSYLRDSQWNRFEEVRVVLNQLTPRTAEDYLFIGQAEAIYDPAKALQFVNKAVQLKNTPIARIVRSSVRVQLAQDLRSIPEAQAAIEDAKAALAILPENPTALWVLLEAQLTMALLLQDDRRIDEKNSILADARIIAERLKPLQHLPLALSMRFYFYLIAGEEEKHMPELTQALAMAGPDNNVDIRFFWYFLGLGDIAKAESLHASRTDVIAREMQRGWCLMEKPGGVDQIVRFYEQLKPKSMTGIQPFYLNNLLRSAGLRDEAIRASLELIKTSYPLPEARNGWYKHLLEYQAGLISEEELLRRAGSSAWNLCESHFFIAFDALAAGNRQKAKEYFRKCYEAGLFQWGEYHISLAHVKRMERDPQWPPWIPQ